METKVIHKKTIILLDILMILGVLSNVGALAITNALVVKATPGGEFVEVNPISAEAYDLKQAPVEVRPGLWIAFGKQLIRYLFMGLTLGVYIWMRHKAYHWRDYLVLAVGASTWFVILLMDFAGNLGFYIGTLL